MLFLWHPSPCEDFACMSVMTSPESGDKQSGQTAHPFFGTSTAFNFRHCVFERCRGARRQLKHRGVAIGCCLLG